MKFDPLKIIGKPFSSLDLTEDDYILDDNGSEEYADLDLEPGYTVNFTNQACEIWLDESKIINRVLLFPRAFSWIGIDINTIQPNIRSKFSKPQNYEFTPKYSGIDDGAWDEYIISNISFHFEYESPLMKLILICVSSIN